jgi:transcriptional regulator with XRE-family HTH domain
LETRSELRVAPGIVAGRKGIMAVLNSGRIVRNVRNRLELSQEGLSRLMNSTKGAVQHWERGRNIPSLARLLALRQLCPPSHERKHLDALIKQAQNGAGPHSPGQNGSGRNGANGVHRFHGLPPEGVKLIQRENDRLLRQVAKLESALKRREERVRILEGVATDLQREMAQLRARQ